MAYDAKWDRWVKASLAKHFDAGKGSLYLYIEGTERKTHNKDKWLELKVRSSKASEGSADNWRLSYIVIVLCCANLTRDIYEMERVVGQVANLFTNSINVKKYGDGEAVLGCLRLTDSIDIHPFGQLDPDVPLLQTVVEGQYSLEL